MTDLFPEVPIEPVEPYRHWVMLQFHGVTPGQVCKDCQHFLVPEWAGRYFKCRKYSDTHGQDTDWRAGWTACGLFEKREKA